VSEDSTVKAVAGVRFKAQRLVQSVYPEAVAKQWVGYWGIRNGEGERLSTGLHTYEIGAWEDAARRPEVARLKKPDGL
jgi:hypothetical protein